jgi:hypothetical protein
MSVTQAFMHNCNGVLNTQGGASVFARFVGRCVPYRLRLRLVNLHSKRSNAVMAARLVTSRVRRIYRDAVCGG